MKKKTLQKMQSLYKPRNLRKRKILGSEMRTQAFALHSPYEFLFSCEQSKKKESRLSSRFPKSNFFLEASETRREPP